MSEPRLECIEAQAYLPLFVGDDLDSASMVLVRAHVERCGACSTSLDALRAALGAFTELRERVDPRVDLWAGIERELTHSGLLPSTPAEAVAAAARPVAAMRREAASAPVLDARSSVRGAGARGLRRWSYFAAAAAVVVLAWRMWGGEPTSLEGPAPRSESGLARIEPTSGVGGGAAVEPASGLERRGSPRAAGQAVALVGDSSMEAPAREPEASEPSHGRTPMAPSDGLRRLAHGEALLRESTAPRAAGRGDNVLAGSPHLR